MSILNNPIKDPKAYEKCKTTKLKTTFKNRVLESSISPLETKNINPEYVKSEIIEIKTKYLLINKAKTNGKNTDNRNINGIKCLILNERNRPVI